MDESLLRPEQFTDEEREILMLAMLSYRGFQDVSLPLPDAAFLHGAITRGLQTLPMIKGRWEIVWGPVSHRLPGGIFDASQMYVVRGIDEPTRYVVVIRGTNPVSALDWLLGDFWSGRQLRWTYGTDTPADAKISFSTALGLEILRRRRSTGSPRGIAGDLWRFIDEDVGGHVRRAGEYLLQPLKSTVEALVTRSRSDIRTLVERVTDQERALAALTKPDLAARVEKLLQVRASGTRADILRRVDAALHEAGDPLAVGVLRFLEEDSLIRQLGGGQDILTFLTAAVAHAKGPIDVTVTGHSKGGALAPTFALWLADTQGTKGVPAAAQWDPRGDSVVRCFSYAGPSAGNAAFAAHSDRVLGERCHRIWNTLDVVPHAWVDEDVREIATLYVSPPVHHVPRLGELAGLICDDMANDRISYAQIGRSRPFSVGINPDAALFVDQFVYQHAEAYLKGLGCPVETVEPFFSPLG